MSAPVPRKIEEQEKMVVSIKHIMLQSGRALAPYA
mgnify:CR=1 FL=1